ncbi:MAG: beta-lactamase family protein [Firmicutes bacterium]|nr:beta-lactamase family protein [Bacillota bacterium]
MVESPARAGFDPELLERALQVVRSNSGADRQKHAYPGAVAVVARSGRLAAFEATGYASLEPGIPMRVDHVFDIASLTKVVATTTAVLLLLERGLLSLDDRVGHFFPLASGHAIGEATIKHLLTHTSGLPGWVSLYEEVPRHGGLLEAIIHAPLHASPGTRVEYSCTGFILLALLVRQLTGESFPAFLKREVFSPLEMKDTTFLPLDKPIPAEILPRLLPTERRRESERGLELASSMRSNPEWKTRHLDGDLPLGIVHDENAAFLGGVAGNAGLFSTAADLAKFGLMFLNGGRYGDARILNPATVALATRNWTAGLGENRGLGWQLPSPGSSFGDLVSGRCFGHTGFTGTGMWMDPESGLLVILLTNRLQFGRANERVLRVRRLFLNSLAASMV